MTTEAAITAVRGTTLRGVLDPGVSVRARETGAWIFYLATAIALVALLGAVTTTWALG